MIHYMKLNPKPFRQILASTKTIELRLNDEKRKKVKVGDIIVFSELPLKKNIVKCKVMAIHRFGSFKELYEKLPLEKCGYSSENISQASYIDMEEYYSKEEQQKFGVVGIEIAIEA